MKWLSRFQTFLQSVPSRIVGSHVELGSEYVTRLSTAARFPLDPRLEERIPFAIELNDDADARILLTDKDEPELIYTARVTLPGIWSPLFADALAWKMAVDLSIGLPNKGDYRAAAFSGYQLAIQKAKASAFNESFEAPAQSEFVTIRGATNITNT